jgi:hypothetical protein
MPWSRDKLQGSNGLNGPSPCDLPLFRPRNCPNAGRPENPWLSKPRLEIGDIAGVPLEK